MPLINQGVCVMLLDLIQLFGRLTVGVTLLSAVADRFGIWGPHGATNVSWGDFTHFITYTAAVNSFLPASLAPTLAVFATIFETVFGTALIVGIFTRLTALGSGLLIAAFAIAMSISFGVKRPLDVSVFGDCAAAFLLAVMPHYRWSLDELFPRTRKGA